MSSWKFESLDEDVEELLDKISKRIEVLEYIEENPEFFVGDRIAQVFGVNTHNDVLRSGRYSDKMGISNKQCDEERKRIISQLDHSLEEARSTLSKMEIHSRQAPANQQPRMKAKISKYDVEIQRQRKRVNQLRYPDVANTDTSPPAFRNTSAALENDIRQQILMGAASLERTSDSLARSHAVAIETEQIGTEVLGDLGTQREALGRTRGRLVDTQGEISRSRKLIRSIGKNVFYNKILLIIIIILEALILAGLVYWKFFS